MSKIGDLQVCARSEYDPGEPGFIIEQLGYWNYGDQPTWAIPAWEEMGLAHFGRTYPTREAAEAIINGGS